MVIFFDLRIVYYFLKLFYQKENETVNTFFLIAIECVFA